jgi:cytochrome P450
MTRTKYWLGARLLTAQPRLEVRRTQDRLEALIRERAADARREGDPELASDLMYATSVMRRRIPRKTWLSLATRDDSGLKVIVDIMAGGPAPLR